MPRAIRLLLLALAIAGLAIGVWYQRHQVLETGTASDEQLPPGKAAHSKLVVLVVFDQMRGDYLARWADQFGPDGFARLKKDGAWYSECYLPYACSSTGPGHASIATGATPAVHGIIENEWFDRASGSRIYCAQPLRPYERVPPLPVGAGKPGRGAAEGFAPDRLLVDTVADRLKEATGGKGRVFSMSLKDRTTTLMGGRKPNGAYCFDTRDGIFHTGAYYRDQIHPWVEDLNVSGLANSWLGKEWTRFRPDLDYDRLAGPDAATHEGYGFGQKRVFPHPMGEVKQVGPAYYSAVETSPAGNELLLELTKKAITGEALGAGEANDLLCVSFSSNDLIGHQWGPDSWEVLDITLRSDKLIADLLQFLDQKLGADRYVVAITADHGVCPIPEQKRYPEKYPSATRKTSRELLNTLAIACDETFGKSRESRGASDWLEGTEADWDRVWPWVYLNHKAIRSRGLEPEIVADYAAQWLGNQPFMMTAITRRQIEKTGVVNQTSGDSRALREVFDRIVAAYLPARCGDVIAVVRPGVLITNYPEGTSHGTPHAYDTHVPFLMYGAGVPAIGKRDEKVSSLIVAPALSRALGIDPPKTALEKLPAELLSSK